MPVPQDPGSRHQLAGVALGVLGGMEHQSDNRGRKSSPSHRPGLEQPVFLVLVASALAGFIAPVIYFLNFHYCLKVIPREDTAFHPSAFARWFTWLSLALFTGMTVILIWAEVFAGG